MAATKTANRCQACAVRPAGTGVNQMPMAIAKGSGALEEQSGRVHFASLPSPAGPIRTRPLSPAARPWIEPSSASITYCHENS